MPKFYVISDIHGFYKEMREALDRAGFDPNDDNGWLISLGDEMDRGSDPEKVINYIMNALCDDLEADFERDWYETPWCYYFTFELDCGRAERAKNSVRINDVVYPMCNAGQLYDFLVVLNEREKEEADGYSN